MIIVIGHMVTIPTVLAVSEIATNRRVAGGGAYFIISRSFGTTIGGSIGIALYLSQAISVAFYLVAFAEAFKPVFAWAAAAYDIAPTAQWISIPALAVLVALMLGKGAAQGVRVLWIVCGILAAVIMAFLFGSGPAEIRPDGLNAAMMLMLAYIIVGHPEWRTAEIRVFACVGADQGKSGADELSALIGQGRLPISSKNIEMLSVTSRAGIEAEVAYRSSSADLVIAGISSEQIEEGNYSDTLQSHAAVNDMLFVHATERIEID